MEAKKINGNKYGDWQIAQEVPTGNLVDPYYCHVQIRFSPNPATVSSDEIAFVQIVRVIDTRTSRPRDKLIAQYTPRMTKEGWAVDVGNNRRLGWFGYDSRGRPLPPELGTAKEVEILRVSPGDSLATPPKAAVLEDVPGDPGTPPAVNVKWEFQTFAVSKSLRDRRKVYGGLGVSG